MECIEGEVAKVSRVPAALAERWSKARRFDEGLLVEVEVVDLRKGG